MFEIIENIYEEGNNGTTEDAYVIDEKNHRYAVIGGLQSMGETQSARASHIVRKYLLNSYFQNDTLENTIRAANREIGRYSLIIHTSKGDFKAIPKNCCSVIAIKVKENCLQYVHSGNCMLFVQYKNREIRKITYDHLAEMDREAAQEMIDNYIGFVATTENLTEKKRHRLWLSAKGISKSLWMMNRLNFNTPDGFSILDGSNEAPLYWESGKIPLTGIEKILLLSDGLQLPKENPQIGQENWMETATQVFQRGLEEVYKEIEYKEMSDPDCFLYPRMIESKDKTGILLGRI